MNENGADRKARGAFYTPPAVVEFLCTWAIRDRLDEVIEPSCGDGEFVREAVNRKRMLSRDDYGSIGKTVGIDVASTAVIAAKARTNGTDNSVEILQQDFFDLRSESSYDAVIGNPPFIRYQSFTGTDRAKAAQACLRAGVRLSGLASSWAPFVVHAASQLRSDGRFAMVVPAELLSVSYASPVREFLLSKFSSVTIVGFRKQVFPDAQEDTVLLLAEGSGGTDHLRYYECNKIGDLENIQASVPKEFTPTCGHRWNDATICEQGIEAASSLATGTFSTLGSYGSPFLGAVTGANPFFVLSATEADGHGLSRSDLVPISPPGSRHLRGFEFNNVAWTALAKKGAKVFLFKPKEPLSIAARRYIEYGVTQKRDKPYKCRVRTPWWQVPVANVPEFILTYMNDTHLKVVRNSGQFGILNSVYGLRLDVDVSNKAKQAIPVAVVNSVTLLSAERIGRTHAGGLLKMEPRDTLRLEVPNVATLERSANAIANVSPQVARLLRKNDLSAAARVVDSILFDEASASDLESVRGGWKAAQDRRRDRGKRD